MGNSEESYFQLIDLRHRPAARESLVFLAQFPSDLTAQKLGIGSFSSAMRQVVARASLSLLVFECIERGVAC